MTTVADIAALIRMPGPGGRKATKASPSIAEGLTARTVNPRKEGIVNLTPEETLSLIVPVLRVGGEGITGYQRDASKSQRHVRDIAASVERGVIIPTATVALWRSNYYVVEGGHRALAAVMTRTRFRAEIRKLNEAEQRELFHHQRDAMSLSGTQDVLTGDDPLALYVQDVFTAPETPWAGMISLRSVGTERGKITPAGLARMAGMYGRGMAESNPSLKRLTAEDDRFDPGAADELATVLRAFGSAKTNPVVFDAYVLRTITAAATAILRGEQRRTGDLDRWMKQMPRFDFQGHLHIRKGEQLRELLIRHWNKRLPQDRRIPVVIEDA